MATQFKRVDRIFIPYGREALANLSPDEERALFTAKGFKEEQLSRCAKELIDQLHACHTVSQFRAWLSATEATRARLPESELARVQHDRMQHEARLEEEARTALRRSRAAAYAALAGHVAPSGIFREICDAIQRHGIAPTRFGRAAIGDPMLCSDMRRGRHLRESATAKVRAYIERLDAGTEPTGGMVQP